MIKEAAIKKRSKVITGKCHGDAFKKCIDKGLTSDGWVQGFVTDDGQFVNRQEAFEIALACGQIPEPSPDSSRTLVSEDLY